MLYISNSLKDVNRKDNHDLKHRMVNGKQNSVKFRENRTYFFRSKNKKNPQKQEVRMSGQKISII